MSMYVYKVRDNEGVLKQYYSPLDPAEVEASGGLPAEAIMGESPADLDELAPSQFLPNQAFLRFLSWVIARHATRCPGLVAEAVRQGTGYVYISDLRVGQSDTIPEQDVFGYVEVEGGEIKRYAGSSKYRPYTSRGFMQLDPWFHERLLEELRALRADVPPGPP